MVVHINKNKYTTMTKYKQIFKHEQIFRRLTGITPDKFLELLEEVELAYEIWLLEESQSPNRKRAKGAGPKFTLCLGDRLLLLLMYYRTYVTYAFLACIFGIDESNIGRNVRLLEPLLAGVFRIPEKKIKISDDEIAKIFCDGTEQPIERPSKNQKRFYSGKKKCHTRKFQVVTVRKKKRPGPGKKPRKIRIAAVSKIVSGTTHDKKLYEISGIKKPPGIPSYGDTAYIGTDLKIPHKKPRGKELSDRQKLLNKRISSQRICVEHGIGKMKIWRITRDKLRNSRRNQSITIKNVAGLHNMMFA